MNEFDDLLGDNEAPPVEEAPEVSAQELVTALKAMSDPKSMVHFIHRMKSVPIEGIDDIVINAGYAAAVWRFRKAAVEGDLYTTKALHIWLKWAKENMKRDIEPTKPRLIGTGSSSAFGPRTAKVG